MPTLTDKQRKDIEELVIKFMDTLDKSNTNSDYYKELFANMDNKQMYSLISKQYPFRFQMRSSVTEPTMTDIIDSLKIINVPLLEKLSLNYLYKNKDGKPVQTQDCFVGYTHHKKVQQIVTKKNKWATDIANRDMKTGRLIGGDKGSATSDREFEALATLSLDKTMEEFSRAKADSMGDKNAMYQIISSKGMVELKDLPHNLDDSLSKNMMNAYMIGAHLNTNLINKDNYTPYTLKNRTKEIQRM